MICNLMNTSKRYTSPTFTDMTTICYILPPCLDRFVKLNLSLIEGRFVFWHLQIQQNVDYPNVNHPKRQISEPTFSSFYIQTTKNQQLLHAIKYCVISIKYCILYVLYCIVMVTLSEKNLQILSTVWLLASVILTTDYPNNRWSQLVRIINVLLYQHQDINFNIKLNLHKLF